MPTLLSRCTAILTSKSKWEDRFPPCLCGWPVSFSLLQHVIYSVKFFLSYAIPDVSKSTKSKIKREKYLTQKLLHENHLKDMTKSMGVIAETIMGAADNHLRPKLEWELYVLRSTLKNFALSKKTMNLWWKCLKSAPSAAGWTWVFLWLFLGSVSPLHFARPVPVTFPSQCHPWRRDTPASAWLKIADSEFRLNAVWSGK